MTGRERAAVAGCQDRMLREADAAFYDERTCGDCGSLRRWPHRTLDGEFDVDLSAVGLCCQMDFVCDADAPACRWWSA